MINTIMLRLLVPSSLRVVFSVITLFFLISEVDAQSQGSQLPSLRIPHTSSAPRIDHYLNGGSRSDEVRVTDFRQRNPGDGIPASGETTAYLSYDDSNLYVIFVCKDDTDKIRARMNKREAILDDDIVGVFLDTFHDRQRAYLFLVNPLGIQLDGITTEGQGDDYSFDTLWHSQGKMVPDGFVVWIAIPFKSLRFSSAEVQTWGIALTRTIARNNETSFWPYITNRVEGFSQQMASLEGLERLSRGRNIQVVPYGFLAGSRFLDTEAPQIRNDGELRAGVDTKIVLRDSFTLDITVNPDFSQVESDEPQVTVNQRFEVFFPEKRPFFLENAGFFQTSENLFFSRRIADPRFGVRLTGKAGPWAIGGLVIDDQAPGKVVPGDDPSHDDSAAIAVLRLQRELPKQSFVGVLVTSRDFASSSNRVYSFDTRIKLSPTWVFNGQVMQSYTREIDGEHLSGPAFIAEISHEDRNLQYIATYTDRSPDFRSQLGFIPRVDVRQIESFAAYRWRPNKGRVQAYGPNFYVQLNWDRRGRMQDWRVNMPFAIDLKGNTSLFVRHSQFFERLEDQGFRERSNDVIFSTSWLKWLTVFASIFSGVGVNFSPPAGLLPASANSVNGEFGFTLRPVSQFSLEQTYIYSRLGTRDERSPSISIFNNHIFRSKVNYQFTRQLSLRGIIDYNSVLPNTELVALERDKRLTADALLTYLLNPGTALYVGYTDSHQNLAIERTNPPTLRRTSSPTTSTGRQFFVKVSYLLRF